MIRKMKAHTGVSVINIIGIAVCIIFGFLLLCNLIIIIKGAIDPTTPPSVFGITPMVVLSGSMSGEQDGHIETGDLIFTVSIDPSKLAVGDVIAFMSQGSATTHRIVNITYSDSGSPVFTTKGDANNTEDLQNVYIEDIIGIYKLRIPKLGDLALFMQKPLGMLIFVGIPLLSFIIYDIIRRQKYAQLEKRRAIQAEAELALLRAQVAGLQNHATLSKRDDDSK